MVWTPKRDLILPSRFRKRDAPRKRCEISLINPFAFGAAPPIAVDVAGTFKQGLASGTTTQAHTCSGSNRALIVLIYNTNDSTDLVTGVTYAGVAMTRVGTAARVVASASRVWIYALSNPASGANNIVVSCSAAGSTFNSGFIGISFTAANQTTANLTGTFASQTSTTGTSNLAVASASGDIVVDIIAGTSADTLTIGGGETQLFNNFSGASGRKASVGVSTTMTWTIANDAASGWVHCGVAVKGA